jgi:hypothetical protein
MVFTVANKLVEPPGSRTSQEFDAPPAISGLPTTYASTRSSVPSVRCSSVIVLSVANPAARVCDRCRISSGGSQLSRGTNLRGLFPSSRNGFASVVELHLFAITTKIGRTWGSPRTRRPVDRRLGVQLETRSDPSPGSAACTIVTQSRLKMNKSCLLDQVAISRFGTLPVRCSCD